MMTTISSEKRMKAIEYEKDFFKSELLNMGYFKTPDGRQLYELSLDELKSIYYTEKQKRNGWCFHNG